MSRTLRLLVIEDSEDDALLIVHELRRGGFQASWERVETASSLEAALQREAWDAITCDWVMPQLSGPVALDILRRHGALAPVIVVSGQVGEEFAVTAMKAGARDFIGKQRLARLVPAIERELQEAEQRRARARDAARVAFQAQLLDAVEEAVIATDTHGVVTYWNRAAEALYGWSAPEALGQPIESLTTPEMAREAVHAIMEQLRRGESWSGEFPVRRKDGRVFRVRVTDAPVRDASGAVIGVVGVSSPSRGDDEHGG